MSKANVGSRVGHRAGSKAKLRKQCQGRTKGVIARARRVRYNGPVFGQPANKFDGGPVVILDEARTDPAVELLREIFEAQPEPNGRCHGTTTKNTPCKKGARESELYCSTHKPII